MKFTIWLSDPRWMAWIQWKFLMIEALSDTKPFEQHIVDERGVKAVWQSDGDRERFGVEVAEEITEEGRRGRRRNREIHRSGRMPPTSSTLGNVNHLREKKAILR